MVVPLQRRATPQRAHKGASRLGFDALARPTLLRASQMRYGHSTRRAPRIRASASETRLMRIFETGSNRLCKPDARIVRIGAVYQGDIANSLNEISGSLPAELVNQGVAAFPARCPYADFDQFMMRNCRIKFLHHRVGETGIAHRYYGLELMAQPTQVLFL